MTHERQKITKEDVERWHGFLREGAWAGETADAHKEAKTQEEKDEILKKYTASPYGGPKKPQGEKPEGKKPQGKKKVSDDEAHTIRGAGILQAAGKAADLRKNAKTQAEKDEILTAFKRHVQNLKENEGQRRPDGSMKPQGEKPEGKKPESGKKSGKESWRGRTAQRLVWPGQDQKRPDGSVKPPGVQ